MMGTPLVRRYHLSLRNGGSVHMDSIWQAISADDKRDIVDWLALISRQVECGFLPLTNQEQPK